MLQGYTMAIVPCGNPTPKKLPTGGGEWPTFRTARAQRAHSARYAPYDQAKCFFGRHAGFGGELLKAEASLVCTAAALPSGDR